LIPDLARVPDNCPIGSFTGPTPAMPDECKVPNNSLQSYHNYYRMNKSHLWSWKGKINKREVPVFMKEWFRKMNESLAHEYS